MKMISYEKMSKKAQKAVNAEKRRTWGFNPVTRTGGSSKGYNRAKEKAALRAAF